MDSYEGGYNLSEFFGRSLGSMSEKEFSQLAEFIKSNYGLNLEGRKAMVESRLYNYVIDRGFESFSEYLKTVYDSSGEAANIINRLTTNYTYFYREREHFEHFTNVFLPEMKRTISDGELCVWSAGCSFGNEAYTFAACMEEFFGSSGLSGDDWDRRILATDISRNALVAARRGVYSKTAMQDMPKRWVDKYFTEQNGVYKVGERLRSQVVFRYHNLMEPITFKRKFHLIICRNVMIYFDNQTKSQLIKRFYDATEKGGYLYIGHAETVPNDCPYVRERAAVYRKL